VLREIGIRHFVLIDELRLEWNEGLNVLTGETGAGKSIVLDAIGLLLGERFRSESVRQGAERSEIDALFDAPRSAAFQRWWGDHGFENESEIVIRREGYPDGRSRAFLNDKPVTLAALQELSGFLVDVHGQNEHQQILKPAVQLELLDRYAGLEERAASLAPLYRQWREIDAQRNAGRLSEQDRLQKVDLLGYQLKEIDGARLRAGEDAELAARLPELKNAEKLRALAQTAYAALYEEEGSALERLGQAQRAFESLKTLAPACAPLLEELSEAKSRLEETARSLHAMAERWEADPQALEAALQRQDSIARLQKKYGGSIAEVLQRAERLREELSQLENQDAYRAELEKQLAQAQAALEKASRDISFKRQKSAKELGAAVQKQLGDLGFKQAVFQCRLTPEQDAEGNPSFSSKGIDHVAFEWAPNPGEGIQPLKNIASGGEMSRVMLALKTVLAHTDDVPILIFDEIDAGIGGLTALAVGKKLKALSRHHQILCVSHLPQIASSAHAHFQVSKRTSHSRTQAAVVRLEPSERLHELARLLGSDVTPTSVQHAREMLAQNQ
jgi:DNA repair protein RecN (Recombination protein N)